MRTSHGWRLSMVELLDDLGDSPTWGEWRCEIELPDGEIVEGGVQGDEHSFAEETLVDENGHPFTDEFIEAHASK